MVASLDEAHEREQEIVKAKEEHLRLMLEGMPVGILIVDSAEPLIEFTNPAFMRITGSTHQDVIGAPLAKFFPKAGQLIEEGVAQSDPWKTMMVDGSGGHAGPGVPQLVRN